LSRGLLRDPGSDKGAGKPRLERCTGTTVGSASELVIDDWQRGIGMVSGLSEQPAARPWTWVLIIGLILLSYCIFLDYMCSVGPFSVVLWSIWNRACVVFEQLYCAGYEPCLCKVTAHGKCIHTFHSTSPFGTYSTERRDKGYTREIAIEKDETEASPAI
jgi:hypothetical protein